MSHRRSYITTTIPYVDGDPHVGFALELVKADVLARHARQRDGQVRLASGTDDNSLKNVWAAALAGVPVADYVPSARWPAACASSDSSSAGWATVQASGSTPPIPAARWAELASARERELADRLREVLGGRRYELLTELLGDSRDILKRLGNPGA